MTWRRSLALALAAALAVAACGGDDDEESSDSTDETTETTSAPATTTTDEEPPGTDPEAVEPYVQDLLTRYDEVTSQIVGDAERASNRDDPLYSDLRELIAPDSAMAEPVVLALVTQGVEGSYQRPMEDGGVPVSRELDGEIQTVSEDEVTFPMCNLPSYRLFNGNDLQVQVSNGPAKPGIGTAVRVDGQWKISRFDADGERDTCSEDAG